MTSFTIYHDISEIKDLWESLDNEASFSVKKRSAEYLHHSFYQRFPWNHFLYRVYSRKPWKRIDYIVVNENGLPAGILPIAIDRLRKKGGIIGGH